jgi:hypothetical protein
VSVRRLRVNRRRKAGYAVLALGCVFAATVVYAIVSGRMAIRLSDISRHLSGDVGSEPALAPEGHLTAEEAEQRRELDRTGIIGPVTNPRITVLKSRRLLYLYSGDAIAQIYRIGLGFNPVGDKVRQGDGRTPEGDFYICLKNPNSDFTLSLQLSYPCSSHAKRGFDEGLISAAEYEAIEHALRELATPPQNTALGGSICIHGSGSGSDWTLGCVALDDEDIKELYDLVRVGTPVTISP